jgi:hypothetical protein
MENHKYRVSSKDSLCSDHYCASGNHPDFTVVCACGFSKRIRSDDIDKNATRTYNEHMLMVFADKLKIEFGKLTDSG